MFEWTKLPALLNFGFNACKGLISLFKKPDPAETFDHREKLKKAFEEKLLSRSGSGEGHCIGEVVIRDIDRMDEYPDINPNSMGISPWFKVELKGLYHRGIEIFGLIPQEIIWDGTKQPARFATDDDSEERKVTALPIPRIPFDNIVRVDWEGDSEYPFPHIYCHFNNPKREPYECTSFYVERNLLTYSYLEEVPNFRPYDENNIFQILKFQLRSRNTIGYLAGLVVFIVGSVFIWSVHFSNQTDQKRNFQKQNSNDQERNQVEKNIITANPQVEVAKIEQGTLKQEERNTHDDNEINDGIVTRGDSERKPYIYFEKHYKGETFVDRYTGVSLGVSWIHVTGKADVTIHLPNKDFEESEVKPGKTWSFEKSGRNFLLRLKTLEYSIGKFEAEVAEERELP